MGHQGSAVGVAGVRFAASPPQAGGGTSLWGRAPTSGRYAACIVADGGDPIMTEALRRAWAKDLDAQTFTSCSSCG